MKARSVISKITSFDVSEYAAQIGGQVPKGTAEGEFNVADVVPVKDVKKMDDFILFGMAAAADAISDAGIETLSEEEKLRAGVMLGSGIGGLRSIFETSKTILEQGPGRVSPFFIPSCLINLLSGQVSIRYGLKGPNSAIVTACATGAHSVGDAARMIMLGDADMMVAGGAEAAINPLGLAGFSAARALSTRNDDPEHACRPWDKDRDGFVMGEGAGVLVLEEYEHAKARGAKIYAEVVGYGMSGDAYHMTSPAPESEGGYRAMQNALKSAGMSPDDIDYINAHGTSTPAGDVAEFGGVKKMFGHTKVSMSSTKSVVGHLLGAAGAVEAIYSILTINKGVLPPTVNLENVDEACTGIDLVPKQPKEKTVKAVLSNSFGFGGTNASVIFKKI
jgi:3-oxoacyl-[acyl-carrier-protein] synthase II